jgi:hypothetical protein
MKAISLQLVTVRLDNGRHGFFIGTPLMTEDLVDENAEINHIRFSEIETVPGNLTIETLVCMIAERMQSRTPEQ